MIGSQTVHFPKATDGKTQLYKAKKI